MAGDPRTVLLANPGADLYGSDRMAVEAVRAMVQDGCRVIVAVPGPGPLIRLFTDAGAVVIEQPSPIIRKSLLSPFGLLRLIGETCSALGGNIRLIRKTNAGTVIVNTITAPLWLFLARVLRRRAVCYVHEAERAVPRMVRSALYLPLLCTNRIVVNSRTSLDVLRATMPRLARRARVVYNAVAGPPKVVPPVDSLAGRTVRLLYVGRLSQRKGPQVAIEATRILLASGADVRLSLLGAVFPGNEGFEEGLRAQVAEGGIAEKVDFIGFRSAVWPTIADSDIVIIPSVGDESFGNTAVETALAARPLIVSDIAGLDEATSATTGCVPVPPSDPEAVAAAVRMITENWNEYATRAMTDAKVVAEKFSFDEYAKSLKAALA